MSTKPFAISYSSSSGSEKIAWRSPYSIELVKHFGEREHHLPANPSLSMALTEAFAETSVDYEFIEAIASPGVHCLFQGNDDPAFSKSISTFIENAVIDIPILKRLRMNINAKSTPLQLSETFSLAPLFSSLALCLCSIEVARRPRTAPTRFSPRTGCMGSPPPPIR